MSIDEILKSLAPGQTIVCIIQGNTSGNDATIIETRSHEHIAGCPMMSGPSLDIDLSLLPDPDYTSWPEPNWCSESVRKRALTDKTIQEYWVYRGLSWEVADKLAFHCSQIRDCAAIRRREMTPR